MALLLLLYQHVKNNLHTMVKLSAEKQKIQHRITLFDKDAVFVMAVSIFSSSKAQEIHSMKWNNAILYLAVSRSYSFVPTIFLFKLLRLFNSQFALFQVINTMHEIGDQTKKTRWATFLLSIKDLIQHAEEWLPHFNETPSVIVYHIWLQY